jgi:hypothetical protein
MRNSLTTLLALSLCLAGTTSRADEKDDKLEALKRRALENWKRVEGGAEAMASTEHFVLIAPRPMEDKLKDLGASLERHYEQACKALFTAKDVPVKGRLTVYILDKGEQVDAFIRRIEKRRPRRQEAGSFSAADDALHVLASKREDTDPPVELQAVQQTASLLLQRKAGVRTILPGWLLNGFGRATWYRAEAGKTPVNKERQRAFFFIQRNKSRNAQEVWGGSLEGEEAAVLEAHLADFLAYGPARMKFPALVEAFRPGENEEMKSMDQALQAVELKADSVNKTFRAWVLRPN